MGFVASVKVLTSGVVWQLTGSAGAAQSIVDAVGGDSEDSSTIAGMLLTRAGDKAVRPVAEAIRSEQAKPELIDVLAGIGSEAARAELEALADSDHDLAEAAQEALNYLDPPAG